MDYNQSVALITDNTQNVTAAYLYDPFGTITNGTITNGSGTGTGTQATTNPWHYATGYQNTTGGLIKLGARYYNPATGRYTQPDPSGQESNNYAYAGNNPVTSNDPTGLGLGDFFQWVGIGMVGASAYVGATLAAPETLGTAYVVADLACTGSVEWGLSSYV